MSGKECTVSQKPRNNNAADPKQQSDRCRPKILSLIRAPALECRRRAIHQFSTPELLYQRLQEAIPCKPFITSSPSSKRCDLRGYLHRSGLPERFAKFIPMQGCPFTDHPTRPGWQLAVDQGEGFNIDRRPALSVEHMKMRWWMVGIVKVDYDAVEAGDLRHGRRIRARLERPSPPVAR